MQVLKSTHDRAVFALVLLQLMERAESEGIQEAKWLLETAQHEYQVMKGRTA